MSLDPGFARYLDHFGTTVTLGRLNRHWRKRNLVGLRHDVDHDLDVALEVAYWEHERGTKATYFLLPAAGYWRDPRLIEKCLQLQDFGHEVALHFNGLADWAANRTDDIGSSTDQVLKQLRGAGISVHGMSSHGDSLCYAKQFINYWCFAELRPDDPDSESSLSAEGVPDPDPDFQIAYPRSDEVVRDDGQRFRLWSLSMKALGLEYEATKVPVDSYFTDSGGG